jgi:hypothetical protein
VTSSVNDLDDLSSLNEPQTERAVRSGYAGAIADVKKLHRAERCVVVVAAHAVACQMSEGTNTENPKQNYSTLGCGCVGGATNPTKGVTAITAVEESLFVRNGKNLCHSTNGRWQTDTGKI